MSSTNGPWNVSSCQLHFTYAIMALCRAIFIEKIQRQLGYNKYSILFKAMEPSFDSYKLINFCLLLKTLV